MEVRVRANLTDETTYDTFEATSMTSNDVKMDLKTKPKIWRKLRHEIWEMGRVTVNMLSGQGSKLSYLFIPACISLLWLVICFVTTRNPNVTLEEQYIKVSTFSVMPNPNRYLSKK